MNERELEKMINANENLSPREAVEAAKVAMREKANTEAVRAAQARLEYVNARVQEAVKALREARKAEAMAKARLNVLNSAANEFEQTGDWNLYSQRLSELVMKSGSAVL